jgi:hypothetical protein
VDLKTLVDRSSSSSSSRRRLQKSTSKQCEHPASFPPHNPKCSLRHPMVATWLFQVASGQQHRNMPTRLVDPGARAGIALAPAWAWEEKVQLGSDKKL